MKILQKERTISFRVDRFVYAMLVGLSRYWNCNYSEAVRRAIVYTYSKIVAGKEPSDEEQLYEALRKALMELDLNVY